MKLIGTMHMVLMEVAGSREKEAGNRKGIFWSNTVDNRWRELWVLGGVRATCP